MTMNCVVVGAGVLGASIAYRLMQAGASVTVVDNLESSRGATGASFAWVGASHPGLHTSDDYMRLNIAGVAAYRRLLSERGDRSWFARSGCLTWYGAVVPSEPLEDTVTKLQSLSYGAYLVSPDYVRRFVEPLVRIPAETESVGWFPDEGYVFGRSMAADMLAAAEALGARLLLREQVSALTINGQGVKGVELASGGAVAADVVVTACGTSTATLLEASGGPPIRLVPPGDDGSAAVGLLVVTTPLERPVQRVIIADDLMIRPDGGGRTMLHSYEHDTKVRADTPVMPPPALAADVLELARAHVASMGSASVESVRIGVRPLPADGFPILGWVDGVDGLYVAVTHSGFTLAPLVADLVQSEVFSEIDERALRAFRPSRFATG